MASPASLIGADPLLQVRRRKIDRGPDAPLGNPHALVLCYHAVSGQWIHALAVAERQLEHQVRFALRCGYLPRGLDEAVFGSGRVLHVTFDDAFRSVEAGLSILDRLGVPATVFACPDYAEGGRKLDVAELAAEAEAHPDELKTMDWDELRSLSSRGVEVGSHTLSHPHLRRLTDADLSRELSESRLRIEEALGHPCRFLAYPYGEEDERVRAAAEAAGYVAAFGLPGRRPLDRYSLPRVGLYPADDALRTAAKLIPAVRHGVTALQRWLGRGQAGLPSR